MKYESSQFGRVPQDTVTVFQHNVSTVRDYVLSALPSHASPKVRADTLEQILAVVLRDWRENSNTTGLVQEDIADLRSFVTLAVSLAGNDLNGNGRPIFLAVLNGLLEDWLANWNSDNDPGPPGPID